jgi:hypothetical protein
MVIVDCKQVAVCPVLVSMKTNSAMPRFASRSSLLRHVGVGVERLADDAALPAGRVSR